MSRIHDVGGMHGFGAVQNQPHGPPFPEPWQGRVLAIVLLTMARGEFNLDAFRHGIERMKPVHYLSATYYERWRTSVETLLCESGQLGESEVTRRAEELAGGKPLRPADRPPAAGGLAAPAEGVIREIDVPRKYALGDLVRTRSLDPPGHTRLPRYARGRRGRVVSLHPACVLPDTNAHGLGENPEYLYTVRFDGRELWGGSAEIGASVAIDLFESYLEGPAESA